MHIREFKILYVMKNHKTKKQQGAFHKNLEIMTNNRILAMRVLDSEKYIRLLQDHETGFFIVFNGRYNASHYTNNYRTAKQYFNHLVAKS